MRCLGDVCRAVLVAGLFPNLAWIRRMGKGNTLEGLKVCIHPGSVNAKESDCVVAFYDIQETTERWLYDSTVVTLAPCLLFAPQLEELHRGARVVFRISGWEVAVEPEVADDVLALRELLADFVSRSVGHPPTDVHAAATDALSSLFSERAGSLEAAEDDEETELATPRNGNGGVAAPAVRSQRQRTAGDLVECYWPDDDTWLPATVLNAQAEGTYVVTWDADESQSKVPADYLRDRPSRCAARSEPLPAGGPPPKRAAQSWGTERGKRTRR